MDLDVASVVQSGVALVAVVLVILVICVKDVVLSVDESEEELSQN